MKQINTLFRDCNSESRTLQEVPDTCPFCHHAIDPIIHFAYCDPERWESNKCM